MNRVPMLGIMTTIPINANDARHIGTKSQNVSHGVSF